MDKCALVVNFGDNDFSSLMEKTIEIFCNKYKEQYQYWFSDCASYISEEKANSYLDNTYQDIEKVRKQLKAIFIGVYLSNLEYDILDDEEIELKEDDLESAKESANYLFDGEKKIFIGKKKDAEEWLRTNHSSYQDKETLEKDNVEEYWYNGELIYVLFIQDEYKFLVY